MRTFIAALLFAGVGAGLPTGGRAESGSIICERELGEVRSLFHDTRGRLSPAEAGRIEQRLDLAPTYCQSAPYASAVTLSGLDQVRRRLEAVSQLAEVPSTGNPGTD